MVFESICLICLDPSNFYITTLQLDCKVKIFHEKTYPQIIRLGFTFIKLAVAY